METMAQRLKRLRMAKELSLKDVSHSCGIPTSTYREWEYGRAIKGEPYVKIADTLGVTLHELLTGEKPKQRKALVILGHIEDQLRELRAHLQSLE